jgi:iron(III) transport system substrate-binding protein
MTRNFTIRSAGSTRRAPWALLGPSGMAFAILVILFVLSRQLSDRMTVVVYTSQDQVYAEPILRQFEEEAGIPLRVVYDSEAVKTVGLVNRLIAERDHPQCDVFWNNEELRTRQLEAMGVLQAEVGWAPFGYRSRRVVIHTNLVGLAQVPRSLLDLTNAVWKGRVAIAYPLFGTTATHFLALRHHWGEEVWKQWCRGLRANEALVVDGNSMVVKLVGQGEAWVGLTDSDDIAAGQREGLPVIALPVSVETLLIPNTVALVRGGVMGESSRRLMEYLQQPATLGALVEANALESAGLPADDTTLQPDWPRLMEGMQADTAWLKDLFIR